jgi:outer membrane protein
MKELKIFVFVLFLGTCSVLFAQEQSYKLTLRDAVDYAVQNNKILLNAEENVSSAKEKVRETLAQGLPQVDAGIDYLTYFNYKMSFGMGDYKVFIELNDQMSGKIQVSQLIFNGQYWAGLQTAKIAKTLADQSYVKSELDVKENVTNSYFMILILEQNLQIIKENTANLESVLAHTTNMFKSGIAEETDVDQLKVTLSQLKNSQKTVERTIQLNYNMLRFQLGVAPDAEITLTENIDQLIGTVTPETAIISDFDITANINYKLTESQVELSRKQIGMQSWAYAPTIAGYYNYTEKFMTTNFDMTPNHMAGLTVSVPIFSSGLRRSKVSQAKIDNNIALRNQEIVKEQLETQERQLVYNYQNALENFNTQKENVNTAIRVYKSIENKYKQGLMSSLDLTQANSNYLSAENNYLSSISTLLQAQTSLDKLYDRL